MAKRVAVRVRPAKMDDRYPHSDFYVFEVWEDACGNAHMDSEPVMMAADAMGATQRPLYTVVVAACDLERDPQFSDEINMGGLTWQLRALADWMDENAGDILDKKSLTIDGLNLRRDNVDMDVWVEV